MTTQLKKRLRLGWSGYDNQGKPRLLYWWKIWWMSDSDLYREAKLKVWLSAYAANNCRSDYHWHVDAIYDECVRRNNVNLYERAWKQAFST